jgi:hypothetical protein
MARLRAASVLAVLAVLLAPGVARAQGADAACFLTKANEARAAKGLPALTSDATLASIAAAHAQKMAQGGQTAVAPIPNEQIVQQVPSGFQLLGQNVGSGGSCEAIASNFANLPAEQNRTLDSRYDRIGVGVAQAGNFLYVHEIFLQSGTPRPSPSPAGSPATKPTPTPARTPSPSPTVASTEAAPSPSPTESPSPTAEVSPSPTGGGTPAAGEDGGGNNTSLVVAFVLAVLAAAALGAFVQARRGRG